MVAVNKYPSRNHPDNLFPERFEESPGLNPRNRKAISGDDIFGIRFGINSQTGFALQFMSSLRLHKLSAHLMEAIRETVINVMQGLESKKTGDCEDPQGWLKKALTTRELRHIQFNYFKKGILSLHVDSSSWLYNLSLKKEGLLLKLNKQSSAIKDIRLRIGEIK